MQILFGGGERVGHPPFCISVLLRLRYTIEKLPVLLESEEAG